MRIGNLIVEPWSKKNCIYRIVAILLVVLWIFWGITLFMDGQMLQQRLQEVQLEAQREEARAQREAAFRRAALERQGQAEQLQVQNAADAFK